jgi:hypothetical protein
MFTLNNIPMKNLLLTLVVFSLLIACSKESPEPNIYKAVVKQNFTTPYKKNENIQVNDYVPYIITIEDNKPIDDNTEYRLTPINKGNFYHQKLWVDFGLYLKREDQGIYKNKTYITFSKKGIHNFYIRPLVPGSFKHTYKFQKFVKGEPIGEALTLNLSFNAVIITFKESEFIINDGEDEDTDTYFSAKEITESTFSAQVLVKEESEKLSLEHIYGNFKGKKTNNFHILSGKPFKKWQELTIEQKIGDLPLIVKYYNY